MALRPFAMLLVMAMARSWWVNKEFDGIDGSKDRVPSEFQDEYEAGFPAGRHSAAGRTLHTLCPIPIIRALFKQDFAEPQGTERMITRLVPSLLHTYAVTLFEAYWQDLALAIYLAKPQLLAVAETKMGAGKQKLAPGASVEDRVDSLFFNGRYDRPGEALWEHSLGLPFSAICQGAQTSPQELDRAKAIRNIHIHNGGLVNKRNINRLRDPGIQIGDEVPVTVADAVETGNKIHAVVLNPDEAAVAAYPQIV